MKKYIAILIAVFVIVGSISVFSALAETFDAGDANMDGKVNIRDATYIQRYVASMIEFSEKETELADVNADGKVNIKDATMVQKYIAGLITRFPAADAPVDTKPTEPGEVKPTTPEGEKTTEPVATTPTKPSETTPSVDEDGYNNQIVRP